MKTALAALLLALAIGQAAATCAQIKGVSSTLGNSACGTAFDESNRGRDIHLRRVTLWYADGCLNGIKTEYAGKGGDKTNMHGTAKGEQKSMGLGWTEFVKDVDIKGGRCIEGLKLTTTTGQSVQIGATGTYVSKALSEAYVFGFKGTAGGCGVSSLALIWAVEDCGTKVEAVPKPAEVPTPVPVPTPRPVPVPVPVDRPVPTPVDRPVPVPVPVDRPVPTPVDRPVPVPVDRPVPTPVDRPVPVPVPVDRPVPTPVDRPVPVPVDRPVPVPTPVDRPVPVPVPTPVDRPVPVPVERRVPVPTPVDVPVPVPVLTKAVGLGHLAKTHPFFGRKLRL